MAIIDADTEVRDTVRTRRRRHAAILRRPALRRDYPPLHGPPGRRATRHDPDRLHRGAGSGERRSIARLRELFAAKKSITTFGPYSPGQAVSMKRMGIEGIYLGGWATSAKGSTTEDPGPDLASYPLSQVPDEAAVLVRALLTADRNQHYQRLQHERAAARHGQAVRLPAVHHRRRGHRPRR